MAAKKTSDGKPTEGKKLLVRNQRDKILGKAKRARTLKGEQISVVGIEIDVPGKGIIALRPGGGGGGGHRNSWDGDLTDPKADRDPTDQFFDMDSRDGISDMDPCDALHRGRGGPIIIA